MKRRACMGNDRVKAIHRFHTVHEYGMMHAEARADAPDQLQRRAVLDLHNQEDLVQAIESVDCWSAKE